jgi:hypothetical protein
MVLKLSILYSKIVVCVYGPVVWVTSAIVSSLRVDLRLIVRFSIMDLTLLVIFSLLLIKIQFVVNKKYNGIF